MNRALWRKAIRDAWLQLAISSTALLVFAWIFVWLMRQFPPEFVGGVLRFLPDFLKALVPVPADLLSTRLGQFSVLYVHLVTMLVALAWALGRGSAAVSAEVGRGTMDLLASLPVWRTSIILVPGAVATLGAFVIAFSLWLGMALAVATIHLETNVPVLRCLPGAVNLFAFTYCLTGLSACVSSGMSDRWRAIATSGGVVLALMAVEVIRRLWVYGAWLKYLNFLSAFQPQELILLPDPNGGRFVLCNGCLLVMGTAFFAVAMLIFSCRDIRAGR